MLTEKQILEKGFEKVGRNLYKKDGQLYAQHLGELKSASFLSYEIIEDISDSGAYDREMENIADSPKKKEARKIPERKQEKTQITKDGQSIGVLVVRDENEAHDFINIKDDEQVLEEMRGKYLEEFVYSFETKEGRKITGLSWAGTKEIVRSAGNIEVEDIKITETEKTYRVLAKARDTIRNVAMYGVAEQSKKMKLKDGTEIEDLHALSKCVSRAQRNALRVLIPELTIKTMIETYLKNEGKK